jgi:hypothetical protein
MVKSVAAGSAILMARQLTALARESTPDVPDFPRADHPLNGAWEWTRNISGDADSTHGVFHRSGIYLEFDRLVGVGIGFWRATSETEADLTVQYQHLDGTWQSLDGPVEMFDADFVPAMLTFMGGDILTLRTDASVINSGTGITLSGVISVYNVNGTIGYTDSLTRNGRRMVISE